MRRATQLVSVLLVLVLLWNPAFAQNDAKPGSQPAQTQASKPDGKKADDLDAFGGFDVYAHSKNNDPWKVDLCAAKECLQMGLNEQAEQLLVLARDRAREIKAESIGIAYCCYFRAVALQRLKRDSEAIDELREVISILKQIAQGGKPVAELSIFEFLLAYLLEKSGDRGEAKQQLGRSIADLGAYLKIKVSSPVHFGTEYVGQSKPFVDPEFYFPSDTIVARKLLEGETKETLPAMQKSIMKIAALCDIRSMYGLASHLYDAYAVAGTKSTTYEQEYWRSKMVGFEREYFNAWSEHAFWFAQLHIKERLSAPSPAADLRELFESTSKVARLRESGSLDEAIRVATERGAVLDKREKSAETRILISDNELMLALLKVQQKSNFEAARKHFVRSESQLKDRTFDDQSQLMEVLFQKAMAMKLYEPKSDWFTVFHRALSLLELTKPTGTMYSRTFDLDTSIRLQLEDALFKRGGPWGFAVLSPDALATKNYANVATDNDDEAKAKQRTEEIQMRGGIGALRELVFKKSLYFCYCAFAEKADISGNKAAQEAYEVLSDGAKDLPPEKFAQGMMNLFDIFLKHDNYLDARRCLTDILATGSADPAVIALCYARLSSISFEEGDIPFAESFADRAMAVVGKEKLQGAPLVEALSAAAAVALEKNKLSLAHERVQAALRVSVAGASKKSTDTESIRLRILLADVLRRQRDFSKSRENVAIALKLVGTQPRFMLERAKLLQLWGDINADEGKFDSAILGFKASTKTLRKGFLNRDVFDVAIYNYRRLADCFEKVGNQKEASLFAQDAAIVFNQTLPDVVSRMSFATQCEYLSKTPEKLDTLLRYCCSKPEDVSTSYSYVMKWKGFLVELLRRQSALIYVTQSLKPKETARLSELRGLLADWELSEKRQTDPEVWLAQNDKLTQEKESLEQMLWDIALSAQRSDVTTKLFSDLVKTRAASAKTAAAKTPVAKTPTSKTDSAKSAMQRLYGERHVGALYTAVVRSLFADLLMANRSLVALFMQNAELKLSLLRAVPEGLKDVASFQKSLTANEAVIDFVQFSDAKGEAQIGCFLIAKELGPLFFLIGKANEVESAISAWREDTLWQSVSDKQTFDLSELLLSRVLKRLPAQIDRVWISPDGELARVPFETLVRAQNERGKRLVSQIDSVREMLLLRDKANKAKEQIVANYAQNAASKKAETSTGKTEPAASHSDFVSKVVLVGDVDFGDSRIPALPQTKVEIASIRDLAEAVGDKVQSITGSEATKSTVSKQMIEADWLHLATHGYFSGPSREVGPENIAMARSAPYQVPTRAATPTEIRNSTQRNVLISSGIILAKEKDSESAAHEGRLTAEELVGVNLSKSKLFTLSACDTGRGKEVSGQGVIGLRSAIMAAGAKCVLMSLWKVDDEATRLLMEDFYSNLWKLKLSPAESLRRAQEKIREKKRFRNPFFWSAWILVGDAW